MKKWTGISFPFKFNNLGRVETSTTDSENFTHITESISQLSTTGIGERFFSPVGTNLKGLTWKPMNANMEVFFKSTMVEQLALWEKRVMFINVDDIIDEQNGTFIGEVLVYVKDYQQYSSTKVTIGE